MPRDTKSRRAAGAGCMVLVADAKLDCGAHEFGAVRLVGIQPVCRRLREEQHARLVEHRALAVDIGDAQDARPQKVQMTDTLSDPEARDATQGPAVAHAGAQLEALQQGR
jgi:hypothetical protein